MPLKLRTVEGPLTNAQIDANLVYLEEKIDSEVAAVEQVAQSAEAEAQAARAAAETAQDSAQAAEAGAQAAQTAAESALEDAVAVVYSGDASLTPAPGKIPVARADSYIDAGWLEQLDNLEGVAAQSLHRSPNAITALFVYDTSKDSDGGAWTEKCQHTSWYNEPISGKWLGAHASEASARAVSGATTGDYFQLSTNGAFYRLDAGSGTTQVYRGSKRDFPRLAAIVAEAASVTIYDLTEPGSPMWMRVFNTMSNVGVLSFWNYSSAPVTSVYSLNGLVCFGVNTTTVAGICGVNFTNDVLFRYDSLPERSVSGGDVSKRNSQNPLSPGNKTIIDRRVTAIAMTVLPDAPVDPVSGLKVPTIAVATAGGISVIKDDGTVVNSSLTFAFSSVTLGKNLLSAGRSDSTTWYSAVDPGLLGASFAFVSRVGSQSPDFNAASTNGLLSQTRGELLRRPATAATVQKLRNFESDPAKGLAATISNLFSTGHQPGDIRRTFLSDGVAGSVSANVELVANGGPFVGTTGWTPFTAPTASSTLSVEDGALRLTRTGSSAGFANYTLSGLVAGKSYRLKVDRLSASSTVICHINPNTATTDGTVVSSGYGGVGTVTLYFVADRSVLYLALGTTEATADFNNISVKEAIADRSYKSRGASIFGTLTRAAVASGAELVAYEGFSPENYLQEPYSADLDFGTGEWIVGTWANIPAANAAAGTIACREHSSGAYIRLGITSGNLLTATANDGTTTRTVTTSASYNNATWIKPEAVYTTDGTLAIRVNGNEVAATRGNPLLTLNNSDAALTIGNSYALDAPFPGKLALVKISATVPTSEQSVWMYEQEKQLFREGAKCVLPDSGALVDLAYDEATDKWIAASAANISEWSGLIRTNVIAAPAGSYSKLASGGGVTLSGRTTTSPGVDVTIPAYNLREELIRRAEDAARLNANLATFDYNGGFTANTTNNNTAITSVAGLSYPASYIGARVTGSGIPADTVVSDVSGTTIYLSKAATATATGVQIAFTDFALPVGYEAKTVSVAGAAQQEGPTKSFTRLFDGFKETVRFGAAPAYDAWVQIQATRSAA